MNKASMQNLLRLTRYIGLLNNDQPSPRYMVLNIVPVYINSICYLAKTKAKITRLWIIKYSFEVIVVSTN
jgi:hypothetical protein